MKFWDPAVNIFFLYEERRKKKIKNPAARFSPFSYMSKTNFKRSRFLIRKSIWIKGERLEMTNNNNNENDKND